MRAENLSTTDTDIANIHLDILGETRVFPVPVPLGERLPLDLLSPARELARHATRAVVDQALAEGRTISCKAGCGACCRQLVDISVIEALSLADMVAAMPRERQRAVRRRFVDAVQRLEAVGLLDPGLPRGQRTLQVEIDGDATREVIARALGRRYFAQGIPCPFLENESCGIHPERPLVCREYHVTSPPEHCSHLYEARVDSVQPPLHMSSVLGRTAGRLSGAQTWTIPLVLSLEWSEVNGDQLRQGYDGMEMFKTLIREIDQEFEQPFDSRRATDRG